MKIEHKTTYVASVLAQTLLVGCVLTGLFQVGARFIFDHPADWTEVLTRFMLIWMVFVGTAVALREGALVSVDLLHRTCKGRAKIGLEAFITTLIVAFLCVLVYYGCILTYKVRFQNVAGLEVAMSWAYAAIPVGSVFSIISVLGHFFNPQRHELENAV